MHLVFNSVETTARGKLVSLPRAPTAHPDQELKIKHRDRIVARATYYSRKNREVNERNCALARRIMLTSISGFRAKGDDLKYRFPPVERAQYRNSQLR